MTSTAFYTTIAVFDDFARVIDPSVYRPAQEGSWLGVTDIVNSTGAIAQGRYKAVNFAGAALVSALMNALGHRNFPFVFGGDGAAFVAPAEHAQQMREVVAATMTWVRDDLGLELRGAMVPVSAIRAAGRDLHIARFAASPAASYAMFAGGGLAWGETEMKRGGFRVEPAAAGTRPDLTGLSCRWQPLDNRNGTILSLIVRPAGHDMDARFAELIARLLGTVAAAGYLNPVPPEGPHVRWPPQGLALEARAGRRFNLATRALGLLTWTLLSAGVFASRRRVGRFDPEHYRRQNALNADFRKFDDGLKLTIDCSEDVVQHIWELLENARRDGIVRFGMHRQSRAQITCVVPSVVSDEHFHFIDGADGGYAMAASRLA